MSDTAKQEQIARLIAGYVGRGFDDMMQNKAEWVALRGEKHGNSIDVNEPTRDDCLYCAAAIIEQFIP